MLVDCPTLVPSRVEEHRCLHFAKKHFVHPFVWLLKLLRADFSWAGVLDRFDSMLLVSARTSLQAASKLEIPMSCAVFV